MAEAKIIIKAQDKTKDGINSASSNLKKLSDAASKLGINLKSLTAVGVTVAALKKLGEAAKQCCDEFLETENTYLILKNALGNTKEYDKATSSIDKLSKKTLSSKEDVTALYSTLVQLGKGDEEINKIIEASISLSNVTGKSLTESFNVMLDSLDGSVGTLQKYLPEVKNMTKEELALGKAVDAVNSTFGETSDAISGLSYSQQIKNIKDDMNTIAEDIGSILFNNWYPVLNWFEERIAQIKESIAEEAQKQSTTATIRGKQENYKTGSTQYNILAAANNSIAASSYNKNSQAYTGAWDGIDRLLSSTITDSTTAMHALYTVMDLVHEGLLSVDDDIVVAIADKISPYYSDAIGTLEREAVAAEKMTKAQEEAAAEARKTAEAERIKAEQDAANWNKDPVWGGSEELQATMTAAFNDALANGYQEGIFTSDGTYSGEITSLLGQSNDYLQQLGYLTENKDELFQQLVSSNEATTEQFQEVYEKSVEDIQEKFKNTNEQLAEVVKELHTNVSNAISSYVSYLSEGLASAYDSEQQTKIVSYLQSLYDGLVANGEGGTKEAIYLKNILDNIRNGIIPNLGVDSFISSYSSYLDDSSKSAYELGLLNSKLEEANEMRENMFKNQVNGYETYTQEQWNAVDAIIDGVEEAIENYGKDEKVTTKQSAAEMVAAINELNNNLDSAVNSYSSYVSEDTFAAFNKILKLNELNEAITTLTKDQNDAEREQMERFNAGDDSWRIYSAFSHTLAEIINGINNEIAAIKNGTSDIKSYVSANSSYINNDSSTQSQIDDLNSLIAQTNAFIVIVADMIRGGNNSEETRGLINSLNKILVGQESELEELEEKLKNEPESEAEDYISKNSSYLSEATKNLLKIEDLEGLLNDTDEMIAELKASGNYDETTLARLYEIREGQDKELQELKKGNANSSSLNWSDLGGAFEDAFKSFSTESIDLGLISDFTGAISEICEAIEPLLTVILSSNPIIAFIILILKELAEILSPFLSDTIEPFTDLIHNLAESISGWIIPILGIIKGVLGGVCDILEMILLPILEMLTPVLELICGVLKILAPIMEWLKGCIIEISTVFVFVADAIKYAMWKVLDWLGTLHIGNWYFFPGVGGHDYSSLSSYDSSTGGINIVNTKKALQEKYAYDETDWIADGGDASTSTSVSTASYTGSNNYYFNIYQQAPVVGDGGMQEFAKMIKSEFAELAYLSA